MTAWLAPPCSGPQSALMPGGDRGEEVRLARADQADRAGRAVLLVVGVQDQELLERDHRVVAHLVALRRHREHHREEVLDQIERVVGVQERLADRLLVRVGRDRRQLGHEPQDRELHLVGVVGVVAVLVEGRQGADHRREGAHRVGVLREGVEEALGVLVQQRVLADAEAELVELGPGGELAVDEEVRRLEERRHRDRHQLLDRDAAVAQDPGLTVDERDRRLARGGVDEAVVEGDHTGLGPQLRDVDAALALGAHDHGQLGLVGCRCAVRRTVRSFADPSWSAASVPLGAGTPRGAVTRLRCRGGGG